MYCKLAISLTVIHIGLRSILFELHVSDISHRSMKVLSCMLQDYAVKVIAETNEAWIRLVKRSVPDYSLSRVIHTLRKWFDKQHRHDEVHVYRDKLSFSFASVHVNTSFRQPLSPFFNHTHSKVQCSCAFCIHDERSACSICSCMECQYIFLLFDFLLSVGVQTVFHLISALSS